MSVAQRVSRRVLVPALLGAKNQGSSFMLTYISLLQLCPLAGEVQHGLGGIWATQDKLRKILDADNSNKPRCKLYAQGL